MNNRFFSTAAGAMKIAHASFHVLNPQASLAFYAALGFERRGHLAFPNKYYLYLGLPGDEVSIELGVEPGRERPYEVGNGYANLAILVSDLDALLGHLSIAQIVPISAPYHPHGRHEFRICVLVDPDGYRIELIEGRRFQFPRDDVTSTVS